MVLLVQLQELLIILLCQSHFLRHKLGTREFILSALLQHRDGRPGKVWIQIMSVMQWQHICALIVALSDGFCLLGCLSV